MASSFGKKPSQRETKLVFPNNNFTSSLPIRYLQIYRVFVRFRSWSLHWTTINRMLALERESFSFNAFELQIVVNISEYSILSSIFTSFPTRRQGLLYECSTDCILKRLADSIPSFIIIFFRPFPDIIFLPNKSHSNDPPPPPNQLCNHPPQHLLHLTNQTWQHQPLHPRNHELVAIPRWVDDWLDSSLKDVLKISHTTVDGWNPAPPWMYKTL